MSISPIDFLNIKKCHLDYLASKTAAQEVINNTRCDSCLRLACDLHLASEELERFVAFINQYKLLVSFIEEAGKLNTYLKMQTVLQEKFPNVGIKEAFEKVMDVCTLGRRARLNFKIPLKQPLSCLYIQCSKEVQDLISVLSYIVCEELNVKEIVFVQGLVKNVIIPNLSILGKKLGKRVPYLKKYLCEISAQEKARLIDFIKEENSVEVVLEDGKLQLEFGELLLSVETTDKRVCVDKGIAVSLNDEIDDSLTKEFHLRVLKRELNGFRKELGCGLDEVVEVSFEGDVPIDKEFLASLKCEYTPQRQGSTKKVVVGDEEIIIFIKRAPHFLE